MEILLVLICIVALITGVDYVIQEVETKRYLNEILPTIKDKYSDILNKYNTYTDKMNKILSTIQKSFDKQYSCSRAIVKNVPNKPYEYCRKYIDTDVDKALNNFLCYEVYEEQFYSCREELKALDWDSIKNEVDNTAPTEKAKELAYSRLCINTTLPDWTDPEYLFYYVSPAGRSYDSYSVVWTRKRVAEYIEDLRARSEYLSSGKYQRSLMTPKLREKILKRDSYTCQNCGISRKDEPHLLLEVDHIIPVAKGGKTVESNLQTLCWKCNRTKSDKI